MKRKHVFILLAIMLFIVSTSAVYAISAPQSRKALSWIKDPWNAFNVVVDEIGTPQGSKSSLEIPVYYQDELLFNTNGMFALNRDACFYKNLNSSPNEASAILAAYPTKALRNRTDGIDYAIYDTDSGYRFYLFFDGDSNLPKTIGFPIVIKDMLTYDDFRNIKIGDPIPDVEAVDSVTTLYKKTIVDVWKMNAEGAAFLAKEGHPCTSIHYLKDGILKIEYTMTKEGDLIVSNIIFDQNFDIRTADGTKVSHKIEDIDLPGN